VIGDRTGGGIVERAGQRNILHEPFEQVQQIMHVHPGDPPRAAAGHRTQAEAEQRRETRQRTPVPGEDHAGAADAHPYAAFLPELFWLVALELRDEAGSGFCFMPSPAGCCPATMAPTAWCSIARRNP
jgi:hypothetical protein